MANLEFKRNRENYDIIVYEGKNSRSHSVSYTNVIDKDPKKIAQILIDLFMYGFPIDKALKIFQERVGKRDWLGL